MQSRGKDENSVFNKQSDLVNPSLLKIMRCLQDELGKQISFECKNLTAAEEDLYASPMLPPSEEDLRNIFKALQRHHFEVILDKGSPTTIKVLGIGRPGFGENMLEHKKTSAKSKHKAATEPTIRIARNNPKEIWVSDGWDKKPNLLQMTEWESRYGYPWCESVVDEPGLSLTSEELKKFPKLDDKVFDIFQKQCADALNKIQVTFVDEQHGYAPRVRDGQTILNGQCVAIGGGFYFQKEHPRVRNDYAFTINTGERNIGFNPENLSALFMHAPFYAPKNKLSSAFADTVFDSRVDQMKLTAGNVTSRTCVFHNRPLQIYFATENIKNNWLAIDYGRKYFLSKNMNFDFYYKAGPKLDSALHKLVSVCVKVTFSETQSLSVDTDRLLLEKDSTAGKSFAIRYPKHLNKPEVYAIGISAAWIKLALEQNPRAPVINLNSVAIEKEYDEIMRDKPYKGFQSPSEVGLKLRITSNDKSGIAEYKKQIELAKVCKMIDSASSNGNTALHWAVKSGNTEKVKLLLEVKADATLANKAGERPADIARENRSAEILALFGETLAVDHVVASKKA